MNEPAKVIAVLIAIAASECSDKPAQMRSVGSVAAAFAARRYRIGTSMKVRKVAKIRNRYNQVPHLIPGYHMGKFKKHN